MELQFHYLLTLFASFLFLSVVVKILKKMKTMESNIKQLPPGPWKLPLIGNLHQLVGSLPHRILKGLADQHGPLMHLQLGETSNIVVSSPEIAKEVLITHGTIFSERPFVIAINTITYGYRDIAMAPYGNYWRQVRKICTLELLTAKRVKSFESIRQEQVSNLVRYISANEGSQINLSKKVFGLTYGITSRVAFGSQYNDKNLYSSVVDEIVKLASGFSIADMYPSSKVLRLMSGMSKKLETLFKKSDAILQGIIDEHRERLERGDQGEEAKEDMDVFIGGSETSSTIVDWAMSEMMKNPRVLKKAQNEVRNVCNEKGDVDEASIQELKYLTFVIKETLRLHPSFPLLIPRENREECEINGYRIPAKTRVIVNAWAIARDPNYWTEPERFYPERFLNSSSDYKGANLEFIPFGAGRRVCPGILYALPNIELPLAKLLYHFDWKLPNEMGHEDLDMAEAFAYHLHQLMLSSNRHGWINGLTG
ncbi:Cytochrome P450 71D10 [Hibiscus syriacus]|uniref:Cytochrome P450 71D10 n=1 Tax=Hibiscus syriacus TaxID=106335 RepID=A0A6A3AJN5_HIBSY|nr:Cytochrome P450 71D10 [Hibiscus syriacus]